MGAHIGDQVHAHGQEAPVLIQRQGGAGHQIPALMIADEGFGAVRRPFDGAADPFCGPGCQHIFPVQRSPRPEAAAHIAGHHADIFGRHAQQSGEPHLIDERSLAAGIEGQVPAGKLGDGGARLQLGVGHPVGDEHLLDDMIGGIERFGGCGVVAVLAIGADIAGGAVPNGRGGWIESRRYGGNCIQYFIIHLDQFGGVLCGGEGFGDHHGQRLADMAHLVRSQGRDQGRKYLRAVGICQRLFFVIIGVRRVGAGAGQGGMAVRLIIGTGQDGGDAGRCSGGFCADGFDDCMGVGAAHQYGVQLAVQIDIVGIIAVPGQQPPVFFARRRRADADNPIPIHSAAPRRDCVCIFQLKSARSGTECQGYEFGLAAPILDAKAIYPAELALVVGD